MAFDPSDLSGEWDGRFSYPGGRGPETPFRARIDQADQRFTGTIEEPDLYLSGGSALATIVGISSAGSVDFTKTYRRAAQGYENPVDYVGQVSADGMRVAGVWSLLDMNGQFEMVRRAKVKREEGRVEESEVPREPART